jgi:nitroreductase
MLSDPAGEAHRAFGVLKPGGGAQRATFLIDRVGVMRWRWPKVRVSGHAQEVLAHLEALYLADQLVNPFIQARRAKRALSSRLVPRELVDRLVEAAHLAPSCFNNQPWRLVVAAGETLARVKEALSSGNYWAKPTPVIIAVTSHRDLDCKLSDNRDYFLFGCGMAVGNLMIQATQLGLIAHPIAGYSPQRVKEALGIPADYVLITLVVVGWPGDPAGLSDKHRKLELSPRARKPLAEVVFWERFGRGMQAE